MKSPLSLFLGSPSRVLRILLLVVAVLTALSLLGQYSRFYLGHERLLGFVPEFYVDAENNIPTYFSGLLLLAASILLGGIACYVRRTKGAFRRHWWGLAFIFAYLSVDEVTSLHERLIDPMQSYFEPEGLLYFGWVIPAIGVVLLVGIAYVQFFWHLPIRWKGLFLAAGLLYVGGALGMELIGGRHVAQHGMENMTYAGLATVEEVLEMSGTVVFLYALLTYLNARVARVEVFFASDAGGEATERKWMTGRRESQRSMQKKEKTSLPSGAPSD